ncbi:MAG: hypothetical protein E6K45_09980 [Gammaproteobacteria bacterium]|nr:MAG: hypothetical protein E6K45_09980 [Gammaproteobacteria bacterium]
MRQPHTVALDSHAAATLRYIRASMEAAGTVAVSGSAGVTMGAVGLLAAALASSPALRPHWLIVWLIAATVAALAGGVLMARQASRQGFTLFGAPVRKFSLCLAPGLFGGAVMTLVLWRARDVRAIPGTWLLLYGCALISTSAPTTRIVGVLGSLFALLGLVTFLLPESLQNIALGCGFGGLHLAVGILIRRRSRGSED